MTAAAEYERMARIRARHADYEIPAGQCDICWLLDIIEDMEIAMAKAGLEL